MMRDTTLCSTATPWLAKRPDYGPAAPVLTKGLLRMVQLPLLYAVLQLVLQPAYSYCYAKTMTSSNLMGLQQKVVGLGADWVQMDDVWFMVGLSLAVSASYIIGNGIFYVICDT